MTGLKNKTNNNIFEIIATFGMLGMINLTLAAPEVFTKIKRYYYGKKYLKRFVKRRASAQRKKSKIINNHM
ncbi:MAG: hypothetical protein NWQ38_01745, partial [Cellulophaga sp.]|nr:hypothetical protein [Cellulophaga sp.]